MREKANPFFLVGGGHQRRKGQKADYLLRYTESFPIATVEYARVQAARKLNAQTAAELEANMPAAFEQVFAGML